MFTISGGDLCVGFGGFLSSKNERWTMRYLAGEGFDDGWLGLAVDQRLCDGDAIVFQIMPPHKEAKKLQSDQGGGRAGPDISVHVFRKV